VRVVLPGSLVGDDRVACSRKRLGNFTARPIDEENGLRSAQQPRNIGHLMLRSAPELALDRLARLAARRERKRDVHGLSRRLREADLVDARLVEMLPLVRDFADAIGPPAGAL